MPSNTYWLALKANLDSTPSLAEFSFFPSSEPKKHITCVWIFERIKIFLPRANVITISQIQYPIIVRRSVTSRDCENISKIYSIFTTIMVALSEPYYPSHSFFELDSLILNAPTPCTCSIERPFHYPWIYPYIMAILIECNNRTNAPINKKLVDHLNE